MPILRVGEQAPDVTLSLLDGRTTPLSTYWRGGQTAWIIFLRHLA